LCFLDAAKAFDKINHWTLFHKLLAKKCPVIIVRLLSVWYAKQNFYIAWGSKVSDSFSVSNGVRQGGILSPALFNVYMDDLSLDLSKSATGCFINRCVHESFSIC